MLYKLYCHQLHAGPNGLRLVERNIIVRTLCFWGSKIDDLHALAKIKDIIIIAGIAMIYVERCSSLGIHSHLMCHAVERTHKFTVVLISNLADPVPLSSHINSLETVICI